MVKMKKAYVLEGEEGFSRTLEQFLEENGIHIVYQTVVPSGYFAEVVFERYKPQGGTNGNGSENK